MIKINNKTVCVSTSNELKDILENDNGYEYIYLENDITLKSGITINSNVIYTDNVLNFNITCSRINM